MLGVELSRVLDQLIRLPFKRKAIIEADTTFKKMKKTWLQNSDNRLVDQLVDFTLPQKNNR